MDLGQSSTEYGANSFKLVSKVLTPLLCVEIFNLRLPGAPIWMQTLIFEDLFYHFWNELKIMTDETNKDLEKSSVLMKMEWSQN